MSIKNNDLIEREKNGRFRRENDYSELENDPYIKKWLTNIKSKRHRLGLMKEFCKFLNKTPEQLAKEHSEDLQIIDPLKRTLIAKKQLHAYFGYLTCNIESKWTNTLNNKKRKKDVAWNTAIQYVYSKLVSFYSQLDIPVNFAKKEKPKKKDVNINEKTWLFDGKVITKNNRKEHLKRIRNTFNDKLNIAIFISKLSSGLDDIDLFNLKIKDFKILDDYNVCYLQGNRQKDNILYQAFLHSESCESITFYLNNRLRKLNNNLSQEEQLKELPKDDWLFVCKRYVNGKYSKMKPRYFSEDFKEVCEQVELRNITPKSLRRWFSSTLENHSINKDIVKRMMGQKVDVRTEHYNLMLEQAKEGIVDEFAKFFTTEIEHILTLGNGNRKITQVDKKVEKLEQQNRDLIEQLAETNKKVKLMEEESKRNFGLLFEAIDIKLSCTEHREFDKNCADCIKTNKDYKESCKKLLSKQKDEDVKGFNLKSK